MYFLKKKKQKENTKVAHYTRSNLRQPGLQAANQNTTIPTNFQLFNKAVLSIFVIKKRIIATLHASYCSRIAQNIYLLWSKDFNTKSFLFGSISFQKKKEESQSSRTSLFENGKYTAGPLKPGSLFIFTWMYKSKTMKRKALRISDVIKIHSCETPLFD